MASWSAEVDLVVPFHDLDPMNIVWHGNYAKYFEIARTALLRSIDYDVDEMLRTGYAWPVIELHIRYPRPLRYQQSVRVAASIVEYENRLKIRYQIRAADDGRRLTHGHTVQVAVRMPQAEMCLASPPILLEKLEKVKTCGQ